MQSDHLTQYWTPALAALLGTHCQPVQSATPRLAVFDLDNTVWHGDCTEGVYAAMAQDMLFSFSEQWFDHIGIAYQAAELREIVATLQGEAPEQRASHPLFARYLAILCAAYDLRLESGGARVAYPWLIGCCVDLVDDELHTLHRSIVARLLATETLRPYPAMLALMAALKDAGWEIIAISASSAWSVQAMIDALTLPIDSYFAMTALSDQGRATTAIRSPQTWEDGKAETIHQCIGRAPQLVFGDSLGDDAMMQLATEAAILVDYGKAELQSHAKTRGYLLQPAWNQYATDC